MSFIDREWGAFVTTRLVRPVQTPSADDLSRGFRILAERSPDHWLLWRVDVAERTWIRAAAPRTDDLWTIDAALDDLDVEAATAQGNAQPLGDRPFHLTIGARTARLSMSHAFGDGGTMQPLLAALLRLPDEPEALLSVPPRVGVREIVVPAIRTFGARPRYAARTLQQVLRPPRPPAASQSGGGAFESDVASATFPLAALRDARSAAGHGGRDYSTGTLMLSMLVDALCREGVDVETAGLRVLVDVRSLLGTSPRSGNLARNFYVPVTRSWEPQDLQRDMVATTRSGRPLASTLLSAVGFAYLKARRAGPPVRQGGDGRSLIAYSYFSASRSLEALPWLDGLVAGDSSDGAGRRLVVAGRVASPKGLTVHLTGVGDTLHLTISYARAEAGDALSGTSGIAIRRAIDSVQQQLAALRSVEARAAS